MNDRARSVKIGGLGIDEVFRMELADLLEFMRKVTDPQGISEPLIRKIVYMLEQLVKIGVPYLTLERPVSTLSGGESQRGRLLHAPPRFNACKTFPDAQQLGRGGDAWGGGGNC